MWLVQAIGKENERKVLGEMGGFVEKALSPDKEKAAYAAFSFNRVFVYFT
ncbi:hypothetical protein R9C00_14900 [Flammeovirgaceae bacterium SG7u.111]|nr:hypothetical protein [Flammeovirgaceae bacterium SG7u.132]WPO38747.1 hypothetical protein R9C00_14900 [Flammeovirgaceae bacterium SG7u.111]